VIVYQTDSLLHFIREMVRGSRSPRSSEIANVHEGLATRIWRENPCALSRSQCLATGDCELKAFAESLDETWEFVDLLETDPARARALARAAGAINITLPNYQREWREFLGFDDVDFASGGSDRLIDATVAWGDAAAIRKHLDRHFEAGATQVCIHPVGAGAPMSGPNWEVLEALAP